MKNKSKESKPTKEDDVKELSKRKDHWDSWGKFLIGLEIEDDSVRVGLTGVVREYLNSHGLSLHG